MHIYNTHGLVERITALLLRILSVLLNSPRRGKEREEKKGGRKEERRDVSAMEEELLRKTEGPSPAKSKHYVLWLNMLSHPGGGDNQRETLASPTQHSR